MCLLSLWLSIANFVTFLQQISAQREDKDEIDVYVLQLNIGIALLYVLKQCLYRYVVQHF